VGILVACTAKDILSTGGQDINRRWSRQVHGTAVKIQEAVEPQKISCDSPFKEESTTFTQSGCGKL
jgi:hypothetical protein